MIGRPRIVAVFCRQISDDELPTNFRFRQPGYSEQGLASFCDSLGKKGNSHPPSDQLKQRLEIADFEGNMPADANSEEPLVDQFSRTPIGLEIDKMLVLQSSKGDVIRAGEGMICSTCDNKGLARDHVGIDIGCRFAQRQECQVEPAASDPFNELCCTALTQSDLDAGIYGVKSFNQRGKVEKRWQSLHRADAQSSPFEIANGRDCLTCLPNGLQCGFGLVEQDSSGIGQPYLARASDEKFGVKFFLEQSD